MAGMENNDHSIQNHIRVYNPSHIPKTTPTEINRGLGNRSGNHESRIEKGDWILSQ